MKTFPIGGIHPNDNKEWSKDRAIEVLELPAEVRVPMAQHIGAPSTPIVKKGDRVLAGQLIGQAAGFVSANIHSPISGTVTAIDTLPNGQGQRQIMVVIKREGDDWVEGIDLSPELKRECVLEPTEIIAKIKDAGIVGLGGACFPTHVKLMPPKDCKIDSLVINAVECEPYLTADHRLMLEHPDEIVVGVQILLKALGINKAFIGIEENKPDAIELLQSKVASVQGVEVVKLKTKYPQGGEKQLIEAVTGRQVPPPPALPASVGVVVQNVGTVYAVYQAVQKNKPLFERIVTVTGKSVQNPANLLVRMGTPISQVIEYAGGMPEDTAKLISGGPMMGRPLLNADVPVVKGTSGVLMLPEADAIRKEEQHCIRCSKCVQACPMGLEPYLLATCGELSEWERAEQEWIMSCIECGCCQSSCPSHRPLLDWVRLTKNKVGGIIRSRNTK
jgi:electron transport complex protein RnfC